MSTLITYSDVFLLHFNNLDGQPSTHVHPSAIIIDVNLIM